MFGISLPLIKNIIPKKCDITVVVGKPLPCPKHEEPDNNLVGTEVSGCVSTACSYILLQVQEYLDRYIESLKELYEENREKYNVPTTKPPLEVS